MPPRKSDASKAAAAAATGDEGAGSTPVKEATPRDGINVEDLNLPKSIVTRLAKGVLPPNTQIQTNAMLAMTKSATVFVNYLATHANENAVTQNRKTIAPADVFKALEDLEFPDFRPRLEMELARFNELQANKRNAYRQKVAADKAASGDAADEEGGNPEGPAAKKARISGGGAGVAGDAGADLEVAEDDDDEHDEEPEPEEEEDEEEQDQDQEPEREEGDETMEEGHVEAEDEALDNGEDSE